MGVKGQMKRKVLCWYLHMERTENGRMVTKVYISEVERGSSRGWSTTKRKNKVME